MICVRILPVNADHPTYLIATTQGEAYQQLEQYKQDHPYVHGSAELWHTDKRKDVWFIERIAV